MQDETLILPMMRMDIDPIVGFTREPVTCRAFQINRARFCSAKLAHDWVEGQLKFIEVKLPDLEDEVFPLYALLNRKSASMFADTCSVITHNRQVEARLTSREYDKQHVSYVKWGYDIPPVGVCDALGYRSPTAAWLVLHPKGPALLFRIGDDVEEPVNTWLEHWSDSFDLLGKWPDMQSGMELVVPNEMLNIDGLSTLSTRPRRVVPKGVRRFLFR